MVCRDPHASFFFFNDTATPEIYTLSLHDALPISPACRAAASAWTWCAPISTRSAAPSTSSRWRSEEHTSELQSRPHLVCRLLLEKKQYTTLSTLRNVIVEQSINKCY